MGMSMVTRLTMWTRVGLILSIKLVCLGRYLAHFFLGSSHPRVPVAGTGAGVTRARGSGLSLQHFGINYAGGRGHRRPGSSQAAGVSQLTGITHKKADGSLMGNLSYTYDLNGKRTSASGTLASMELPTAVADTQFDANNRLTRHNGATYSYDKNGNLTSDGTRRASCE